MEYRRLGRSGLKLSALSFGSWVTFGYQLDESAAAECMGVAYDAGVNFFDNAEVYAGGRSEEIMGAALHRLGWPRDSYCVSSKVYWGGELPTQRGLHRKHVVEACHAALRRLKLDHLDLYFCHRPDLETPIEETVRAMHDLVAQGKVLYWGTSEWSAQQIQQAYGVARQLGLTPPTMEQPQYSLLHRDRVEREYLPLYAEVGLGTTVWSPLASGILTMKYGGGEVPPASRLALPDYRWLRERLIDSAEGQANVARAAKVGELARELRIPPAQLAIAWCLKNPHVSTVLLGASTVEQLRENLGAADQVARLDAGVIERLEAILQNKPQLPVQF
ncbi:MAG TPA: aldo/keto reductase [Candidatus Polarisedimenticolaceae bacterium]|nr:aldo/keto reductase [Candidatus Polarisedimenticolaceae bacterium]